MASHFAPTQVTRNGLPVLGDLMQLTQMHADVFLYDSVDIFALNPARAHKVYCNVYPSNAKISFRIPCFAKARWQGGDIMLILIHWS